MLPVVVLHYFRINPLFSFLNPFSFPTINFSCSKQPSFSFSSLMKLLLSLVFFSLVVVCFSFSFSHAHTPYSKKTRTTLIATLDGTMHLVERQETGSIRRVIWSFPTGAPIYHSYRAPINKDNVKENASAAIISGFVECGDDWALYMHDKHFGKKKISKSIAEYVDHMPTFSDDGATTLGSKRSTFFDLDAKTGSIIKIHAMSDLDNASAPWSDDRQSVTNILSSKNKDLDDPAKLNSPVLLLKIFRTDYSLESVGPSPGSVLWTMAVAEFHAVLLCQHSSIDVEDEYASDSGLNFEMPYPCQEIQQVFRLKKNIDTFFNGHDSNDNADVLPQPLVENTTSGELYLNWTSQWLTPLPLLFMLFLSGFSFFYYYRITLKDQNKESELKRSPAKKKKARKSRKNNGTVDKSEKQMSSEDKNVLTQKEANTEEWQQHFNPVEEGVDERRIGKLVVSNKEIAKGSNETIVLEGIYEGRAVAVKRLVKAHHDVSCKEIKNLIVADLIVADCHPNIVRWHGVEYDQNFVYLALERCACNLYDLIQMYSDISKNQVSTKDLAFRSRIKVQMETGKDNIQDLWKATGYPSPLLLKLMRDVVSGVVHLHKLGIIHGDLKPQNVLIIKERSLCAKLSDMGISKRLLQDMSSLGHNATGGGSSGWQAPEWLVQGRQTRAVDLFSLGCVLFFCMARGRHPFGDCLERDVNIVNNKMDLFLLELIPEAEDLITHLLNRDSNLRPKAIEVLRHPFLWSSKRRLSFIHDTSDRVERKDSTDCDLLKALESIANVALNGKWDKRMHQAFVDNICCYRRYKFESVQDLLRVMRNQLNHYSDLPQEIQKLVGPIPEGFNDYFASRFPRLFFEVYKVICKYCKEEDCFKKYFENVD